MPRTAIVAGGGPRIGASVARKFAEEGCSVGLFARSEEWIHPDHAAETYWHLVEQHPSAWTLELDLRAHAADIKFG
jgi:NAD(P)-dependent dehydrogenase (short-subunit alcohol dehydrogenase family)